MCGEHRLGYDHCLSEKSPFVSTHLTGPQSENMYFYAQEYSKALGRTITFQDIPLEPWRDGLLERGLPVHLVNHLATMADGTHNTHVRRRDHSLCR